MSNPTTLRDWAAVRIAFVESEDRPTYEELAVKFSIPGGTLRNVAADQGWPLLRARRMDQLLAQSDAAGLVLAAAKKDETIIERVRNLVVVALEDTLKDLDGMRGKGTEKTRLGLRQTVSFTVLNLTAALKNLGVGSMPKEIRDKLKEGEDANGSGWHRGMLQALNVTINNGKMPEIRLTSQETRRPHQDKDSLSEDIAQVVEDAGKT